MHFTPKSRMDAARTANVGSTWGLALRHLSNALLILLGWQMAQGAGRIQTWVALS